MSTIICPWKENIIIKVNNKPIIVTLLNFGIKVFSKYSKPLLLVITVLETTPAVRGITTNKTTERNSVPHGTNICQ